MWKRKGGRQERGNKERYEGNNAVKKGMTQDRR
jgi:hypothetical protein